MKSLINEFKGIIWPNKKQVIKEFWTVIIGSVVGVGLISLINLMGAGLISLISSLF